MCIVIPISTTLTVAAKPTSLLVQFGPGLSKAQRMRRHNLLLPYWAWAWETHTQTTRVFHKPSLTGVILSRNQNLVLKWSTQMHESTVEGGRTCFWLGLLSPGLDCASLAVFNSKATGSSLESMSGSGHSKLGPLGGFSSRTSLPSFIYVH